jgi:hypothetical protein
MNEWMNEYNWHMEIIAGHDYIVSVGGDSGLEPFQSVIFDY